MTTATVAARRLRSQLLLGAGAPGVQEVVDWFGAVQAQDYPAARWAVAQRTESGTAADVDRLLGDGAILRTHLLRPTWHLVRAADIGWLLDLTGPRVKAATAWRRRDLGLDDATLSRATALIASGLESGPLTRRELQDVLVRGGMTLDSVAAGHVLLHAELDGVVCSGGLRGRQQTYALLESRAPAGRLDPEEALAEIAVRYLRSHGPATLRDLCWWSGLSLRLARQALALAGDAVETASAGDLTMYDAAGPPSARPRRPKVHLLPNFDEYFVAYAERALHVDLSRFGPTPTSVEILSNALVVDGAYAGRWRRTEERAGLLVRVHPRAPLEAPELNSLEHAVARQSAALGRPVRLELV